MNSRAHGLTKKHVGSAWPLVSNLDQLIWNELWKVSLWAHWAYDKPVWLPGSARFYPQRESTQESEVEHVTKSQACLAPRKPIGLSVPRAQLVSIRTPTGKMILRLLDLDRHMTRTRRHARTHAHTSAHTTTHERISSDKYLVNQLGDLIQFFIYFGLVFKSIVVNLDLFPWFYSSFTKELSSTTEKVINVTRNRSRMN